MNVGAAIRFQREKNGLSQKELAQMLNVSNKTVSSWEANRTEPKMDMIEKMCDIFHCKKSEFLGDIFPDGSFDIRFKTNFGELVASFTPQRQSLFTTLNQRAVMLDDEDLARAVEIMNVWIYQLHCV